MRPLPTRLQGPVLIEPDIHGDERGFFLETYRRSALEDLGIADEFVQDNHSRSRRGILRGMHYQPGMAKLLRCARGSVLDVLVDLRSDGGSFGEWEAFELSDDNGHQLYCPDGFGHGFAVTSEVADVVYKCSAYYDQDAEGGFAHDDPDVGIQWPAGLELVASARDAAAPPLREIAPALPF